MNIDPPMAKLDKKATLSQSRNLSKTFIWKHTKIALKIGL